MSRPMHPAHHHHESAFEVLSSSAVGGGKGNGNGNGNANATTSTTSTTTISTVQGKNGGGAFSSPTSSLTARQSSGDDDNRAATLRSQIGGPAFEWMQTVVAMQDKIFTTQLNKMHELVHSHNAQIMSLLYSSSGAGIGGGGAAAAAAAAAAATAAAAAAATATMPTQVDFSSMQTTQTGASSSSISSGLAKGGQEHQNMMLQYNSFVPANVQLNKSPSGNNNSMGCQ